MNPEISGVFKVHQQIKGRLVDGVRFILRHKPKAREMSRTGDKNPCTPSIQMTKLPIASGTYRKGQIPAG